MHSFSEDKLFKWAVPSDLACLLARTNRNEGMEIEFGRLNPDLLEPLRKSAIITSAVDFGLTWESYPGRAKSSLPSRKALYQTEPLVIGEG